MPRGGARPGAGRPPRNLRAVIDQRLTPDGVADVTVLDRVEETIRNGLFVKDAAARVGVSVETLRRWQATGVRCRLEIAERTRALRDMSHHERACVELAERMDRATADSRMTLLGLSRKLAQGGYTRTETTVKIDSRSGAELERTTRTVVAEPDGRMIQWLLTHLWPHDFANTRVEVTGPDGGPIQVDAESVADKLRDHLAELRGNSAAASPEAIKEALAGRGNGHANGNGNGAHGA